MPDYVRINIKTSFIVVVIIMVDTIYSIGYSGFQIDDFINLLKSKNISLVVDVRSTPYSQYFSDYNKDSLELRLKKERIYYRNYAEEFGARQEDRKYYLNTGYLDFDLFSKSSNFLSGVDKLEKNMAKDYTCVLMCAEKDPITCHRTILVSRAFFNAGYKVLHLLPNNITMTQGDIENRLVEKYFPNKDQLTLFDEHLSAQEYICEAYKKQNAAIAYSIEGEIK